MPRRYGHCYIGGSSLVLGAFTSPFPLLSHLWQYRGDVHQGNNLHGEWADPRKSREYRIWSVMKSRCSNPKATGYDYYGGKGITVCPDWRNSFVQFLSDMGRAPTKFHSIDRIDPTGGYEPSNCRWATPVEQAGNKGSSTSLRIRITRGVRASPRGNCSP